MSIIKSYEGFGNQFGVQVAGGVEVSGVQTSDNTVSAVSGLNVANAASGITIVFQLPSGAQLTSPIYQFTNMGNVNSTAVVSGTSPVTINGLSTMKLAVASGATIFSVSGTSAFISF